MKASLRPASKLAPRAVFPVAASRFLIRSVNWFIPVDYLQRSLELSGKYISSYNAEAALV